MALLIAMVVLINIALWATVIWVAVHFISRYW